MKLEEQIKNYEENIKIIRKTKQMKTQWEKKKTSNKFKQRQKIQAIIYWLRKVDFKDIDSKSNNTNKVRHSKTIIVVKEKRINKSDATKTILECRDKNTIKRLNGSSKWTNYNWEVDWMLKYILTFFE